MIRSKASEAADPFVPAASTSTDIAGFMPRPDIRRSAIPWSSTLLPVLVYFQTGLAQSAKQVVQGF
ncbi:MAG: hypothetical protein GX087_02380 [Desulfobulbaceae bacterium]|nr:hypothetical protein [Desulfobulbaceae bacterium]